MNRTKKTVLFLCTHNSARSQMAEGFLRNLYGNRYEAFSAGITPTSVHPYSIEVMKEIGIDISTQQSKNIKEFRDQTFDIVVTVCDHAKESCPFFPGATKRLHKGFTDPSKHKGRHEERMKSFRTIRDEIKYWIENTFD